MVGVEAPETEVDEVSRPDPHRRDQPHLQIRDNIKDRNIRICHPEPGPGARCTIGGGRRLSSARSRPRVRGRMFSSRSLQNNETVTSSA